MALDMTRYVHYAYIHYEATHFFDNDNGAGAGAFFVKSFTDNTNQLRARAIADQAQAVVLNNQIDAASPAGAQIIGMLSNGNMVGEILQAIAEGQTEAFQRWQSKKFQDIESIIAQAYTYSDLFAHQSVNAQRLQDFFELITNVLYGYGLRYNQQLVDALAAIGKKAPGFQMPASVAMNANQIRNIDMTPDELQAQEKIIQYLNTAAQQVRSVSSFRGTIKNMFSLNLGETMVSKGVGNTLSHAGRTFRKHIERIPGVRVESTSGIETRRLGNSNETADVISTGAFRLAIQDRSDSTGNTVFHVNINNNVSVKNYVADKSGFVDIVQGTPLHKYFSEVNDKEKYYGYNVLVHQSEDSDWYNGLKATMAASALTNWLMGSGKTHTVQLLYVNGRFYSTLYLIDQALEELMTIKNTQDVGLMASNTRVGSIRVRIGSMAEAKSRNAKREGGPEAADNFILALIRSEAVKKIIDKISVTASIKVG